MDTWGLSRHFFCFSGCLWRSSRPTEAISIFLTGREPPTPETLCCSLLHLPPSRHYYRDLSWGNTTILAFTEAWLKKDVKQWYAAHWWLRPPNKAWSRHRAHRETTWQRCMSLCKHTLVLNGHHQGGAVQHWHWASCHLSCPFYLPREFPQLFFVLVYIYPRENASIDHIKTTVNKLELISCDSPKFIMGDLKHCSAGKSLKGFHQHVTCTTHFGQTLDKCYGSLPDAYRSVALLPLGLADHNTILLAPAGQ